MPHWRKPYRQAPPLGRPDMLVHARSMTGDRRERRIGVAPAIAAALTIAAAIAAGGVFVALGAILAGGL